MKKIVFIILGTLLLIGGGFYYWLGSNLPGGGGVREEVPDTVMAGEPITFYLYPSTWGKGAKKIEKIYPGATVFYRLVGEKEYQLVIGKPVPLPENYRAAVSDTLNWRAFEFSLPVYPIGTTGEIEYYFEIQNPTNPNHPDGKFRVEGIKKVKFEAFDPMKNVDQPALEIMD